ncbi:hypothetical protein CIK05_02355 [Bdellovibrio sp. qaytius]|nr:hypothetical protein CIK05_02355 [Bdellovibrio sp. qaytius]
MKQLLVIAIALASTTAFASRARVTSLGNSAHIVDTQSIYSNPAKMFLMGDFVNLESGSTTQTTQNTNTEGLLVRSMGDAKAGLSLGHRSDNASVFGLRSIYNTVASGSATTAAAANQQNPIELSYGMKSGDMTWAGTLVYSNYNDKKNDVKESSAGLRLGALTGAWDFNVGIGLGNTAKTSAIDFKGTTGISAYAGYAMNSMYYFGEVVLAGAKMSVSNAEVAKVETTKVTVGAVESVKKDGNEFFYGASLVSFQAKNDGTASTTDDTKSTTLNLPVIVGLEAEATSWMTLRGSLTQSVLINNSKTEVGSATAVETAPGGNNTVAAIGAGLKFNKVTVDGSLSGLTGTGATQALNGNTLLSTVGLTYMF